MNATAIDAQPPSKNLRMLDEKNPRSMMPNSAVTATATPSRHFQIRVMTKNKRTVVMIIVPVAEMP